MLPVHVTKQTILYFNGVPLITGCKQLNANSRRLSEEAHNNSQVLKCKTLLNEHKNACKTGFKQRPLVEASQRYNVRSAALIRYIHYTCQPSYRILAGVLRRYEMKHISLPAIW